jgi:hypothetical protein
MEAAGFVTPPASPTMAPLVPPGGVLLPPHQDMAQAFDAVMPQMIAFLLHHDPTPKGPESVGDA